MKTLARILAVVLISVGLFSTSQALSTAELTFVYRFIEKLDNQINTDSPSEQDAYLKKMIYALDAYQSTNNVSARTSEILGELLLYMCVKRQSINGYVCPIHLIPKNEDTGDVDEYISHQNRMRAIFGKKPLQKELELTKIAQRYANVLCENDHFSHVGPDGSTLASRVQDSNYVYRAIGENLAFGYTNPQLTVIQHWISPGHRKNMLDSLFLEVGVGYCEKNWVIVFGKS